ncbi:hypothetical protein ig2599ANME_0010 [groundwater metagenome]
MADVENNEKTVNEEYKAAETRYKDADSYISGFKERIEILNSKIEHSKSFLEKAKEQIKNRNFDQASINAKEAIKQAEEVFSDVCERNSMFSIALSIYVVLIIISVFGIYVLLTSVPKEPTNVLGIPLWAFIAGLLGAVAHVAHGVSKYYSKGDFGYDDILYYFKTLIQGTILAAPVFLIMSNLTGTEQLALNMGNFTAALGNETVLNNYTVASNIVIQASVSTSHPDIQVLGVACFLTGFFTKYVVYFLNSVANRLFKVPERQAK